MTQDNENPQERDYLDALAAHLKLDPDLQVELEAQVRQSAAG